LGGYFLILVVNALAAALSFMGRTRQQRFPLGRCILAAAGPSTLPVLLPIALVWSDLGGDGATLAVVLTLCLSFWVSGAIERRLPRSMEARVVGSAPSNEAMQRPQPGE
jgi:hypothetical protein